MKDKIAALETIARQLEATPEQRADWSNQLQSYANQFIGSIAQSNAYFYDDKAASVNRENPIGTQTQSVGQLIQFFEEQVEQTGVNPASGKHFGYIPGGGIELSGSADYLAAITNRYAGMYFANPGAVRIENEVIRWMCDLIGYGKNAFGNLTSGGSIANLIAVTAAREAKGIRSKIVDESVVYLTSQVHHCVLKAIQIAGLQECIIREIEMDEHFRMRTDLLQASIQADQKTGLRPFFVVASAGSTDCLLYTSPSPRDLSTSRMPSSA